MASQENGSSPANPSLERLAGLQPGWQPNLLHLLLAILPAIFIRVANPMQFPLVHIDEGSWNMGPKYALYYGNPTAFGLYHMFLSPWHYLSILVVYKLTAAVLPVAREFSALLGLGVVIFTFLLGKRFFNARVGLLAAVFVAYNNLMIISARRAMIDQEVTFYLLAACYFWFHPNRKRQWISGIFLGIASLVKINALALVPALMLNQFFTKDESGLRPFWKRLPNRHWLALFLGFGLSVAVYGIFWRYDPQTFVHTWITHSLERWGNVHPLTFLKEYFHAFPDMVLMAFVGGALALWKLRPPMILFISWPVFHFIMITSQNFRPARYYFPIVPVMALLAAWALERLFLSQTKNVIVRRLVYAFMVISCLYQVKLLYREYRETVHVNTPIIKTANWLKQNVPENASVLAPHDYAPVIAQPGVMDKLFFTQVNEAERRSDPGPTPPDYAIWIIQDEPSPTKILMLDYLNERYDQIYQDGKVIVMKIKAKG